MAFDVGKAQTGLNLLLVLAIIGIVAYGLYKAFGEGGPLSGDCSTTPDNCDPTTGKPLGILDRLDNWFWPVDFPGQTGEVAGTAQTWTGAIAQEFEHPVQTVGSIFGYYGSPAVQSAESGPTPAPVTSSPALNTQLQQLATGAVNE